MSKFCMQCGAQMEDNAAVCPSCGAQQEIVGSDQKQSEGAPKIDLSSVQIPQIDVDAIKNMDSAKKKKVGIIAIAAVAAIIILVILRIVFFAGDYKKPFSNYEKAINTGKGKYIYSAIPEEIKDEIFDDYKKSEAIEEIEDMLDSRISSLERAYGDDVECTIKISSKKKISKNDLKSYEKSLRSLYGEKMDVKSGYKVKFKIKHEGEDDSDIDTYTYNVYNIEGDWYCPSLYDDFIVNGYWGFDFGSYSDLIDELYDYFD